MIRSSGGDTEGDIWARSLNPDPIETKVAGAIAKSTRFAGPLGGEPVIMNNSRVPALVADAGARVLRLVTDWI